MANTDKNKVSRQGRLRKVLTGMGKHFQNITSITIAQIVHPVAELEARIQKDIEASDATDQAKAAWVAQVQMERDGRKQVDPLLRAIKQYVLLNWGDSKDASTTLEDFGYAPRKPRTVKPETKVKAAAQAIATRTARHTMETHHGTNSRATRRRLGRRSRRGGRVSARWRRRRRWAGERRCRR